MRWSVGVGMLLLFSVLFSACALLNQPPVAILVASSQSGTSPLTVSFSASDSYDPDGSIASYAWDFGDGSTATDASVVHTFTSSTIHTFVVTLTVTDASGAIATDTQSIEVLPSASGENNPPTARFTSDPSHGNSPLVVVFNAALSSDVDGRIVSYGWDFGDGTTGSGETITHTFTAEATTNYSVTLTVTDDDGDHGSTTAVITVTVPETVPTNGPTASFAASDPVMVYDSDHLPDVPSLFEVTFDPHLSTAAPGYTITTYQWDFGDGDSLTMTTDATVNHTFASGAPSHTYVVTLTVIDNQGLSDSITRNVTVNN